MKKLEKDIRSFVGAGVGLGLGTAIVSRAEGRAGVSTSVLPAFSTMGGLMAPMGIAMMGGHTLRLLNKGYKMPKKRQKRYKW